MGYWHNYLKDSTSYTYQINHWARLQPDQLEIEEMLWFLFVYMVPTVYQYARQLLWDL